MHVVRRAVATAKNAPLAKAAIAAVAVAQTMRKERSAVAVHHPLAKRRINSKDERSKERFSFSSNVALMPDGSIAELKVEKSSLVAASDKDALEIVRSGAPLIIQKKIENSLTS